MKQINETTFTSDNGLIKFIHGDCMEFMAGCRENEFDLACCDIPYGLGDKLTQGGTWASKYKKGDADWDKLPSKEYFNMLFSVSVNQIIWGGNYASLPACRCFLIWDKVALMDTMADCEFAWTSFDRNAKMFRHVRNTSETRIHITQKPIQLYRWIFKNYAKPTDHILDTHGGSMSSAIAAHMEGLRMTIIELDKEYFDKAINRFKIYEQQQTLF